MHRHPNVSFFAGAVIIAIMVMAAFIKVANACDHDAKTAEQTSTEAPWKANEETKVEV